MKKILVVEDDRQIALALSIRLKSAGYEVLTVGDGREALMSAVVEKPDLILTDIWMPHPIGFLNRERRENLGLAGVPVIYITASKKKDLRDIAFEEGAAGFFEKPYNSAELLSSIAQALDANQPAVSKMD